MRTEVEITRMPKDMSTVAALQSSVLAHLEVSPIL